MGVCGTLRTAFSDGAAGMCRSGEPTITTFRAARPWMSDTGRDAGTVQCRRRGPATRGPPRLVGPWRDVGKRMPYRPAIVIVASASTRRRNGRLYGRPQSALREKGGPPPSAVARRTWPGQPAVVHSRAHSTRTAASSPVLAHSDQVNAFNKPGDGHARVAGACP